MSGREKEGRTWAGGLTSLAISLVIVNFAFDLLRRFDFESERDRIQDALEDNERLLDRGALFLSDNERSWREVADAADEINRGHGALQSILGEIAGLVAELEEGSGVAEAAWSGEGPVPQPAPAAPAEEESLTLETLPDAPLELLEERMETMEQNPFLLRCFQEVGPDHRKWDGDQILAMFEEEFATTLEPLERRVLGYTVESYVQAHAASRARYLAELNLSIGRRIAEGDYLDADETGKFPKDTSEERVVAAGVIGGKDFTWRSSEYPELARLDLVYQYLPYVMLEDMENHFQRRSGR